MAMWLSGYLGFHSGSVHFIHDLREAISFLSIGFYKREYYVVIPKLWRLEMYTFCWELD